ncbi:MAG: 1-acyl-sn-glycerol-3-phosphate acyltransferase [Phycisphaerae bacterium]|nr:MAG: 1-acyl-sn-glycerol-3-phosphate acyltransferase [Phycisphaerae bacterium]
MLYRSTSTDHESSALIRGLHAINRIWVRGYHRLVVSGDVRFPRRGPVILICNHISSLDPILIQAVVPRPVVWMVAQEYYHLPFLNRLFRVIRAIPVARNGRDTTAMRSALRVLREGHVLGIFPEGRISTSPEMIRFQEGVGVLALRSQAPVIPIYQSGTSFRKSMVRAIFEPQEVCQTWGSPIHVQEVLEESYNSRSVVSFFQSQLNKLKNQSFQS